MDTVSLTRHGKAALGLEAAGRWAWTGGGDDEIRGGGGVDGVEGRQWLLLVAGEAEDEGGLGATAASERGLARGGA